MVGRHNLNPSVEQCRKQFRVVGLCLDRRIHLNFGPEPLIIVDVEEQMMGAHFGRQQPTMIGKKCNLISGRNVNNVKSMIMPPSRFCFGQNDSLVANKDLRLYECLEQVGYSCKRP